VQAIDAERIGRAAMRLGAGRDRADQAIDHAAGVVLAVSCGDRVEAGQPLMDLHHNDVPTLDEARLLAADAVTLAEEARPAQSLIVDWIRP
jgi:thymidine phosphorylase